MPFVKLDQIPAVEKIPGYHVRFVHSHNMTFAYWTIRKDAPLPLHAHPHEQVAHVLEGEFELAIEGETRRLQAGMVGIIPPNAQHCGRAITDCRILDAFYPVREDYR
jgi:quercetin dioxygenase-like cupin family protein